MFLKAVGLDLDFQVNQLQGCVLQDDLTRMESLKKIHLVTPSIDFLNKYLLRLHWFYLQYTLVFNCFPLITVGVNL